MRIKNLPRFILGIIDTVLGILGIIVCIYEDRGFFIICPIITLICGISCIDSSTYTRKEQVGQSDEREGDVDHEI